MEAAIIALMNSGTLAAAAKKADVCERTLRNWLQRDDFLSAWRQARRQVLEGAIATLQGRSQSAARALLRNVSCGKPATEVRAAEAVLTRAIEGVKLLELEVRLSILERQKDCAQ
jgi:hypothetical protein